MRIVVVFNSAHPGGSELALLESIKCLHAQGHEIHVITPKEGSLLDRLKPYASSFHSFPYNWFTNLPPLITGFKKWWFAKGYIFQSFTMGSIFQEVKADKVITNSVSTPVAAMACARMGIPHYWYIHEFGPEDHNLQFIYGEKFTVELMARWSERVLVNSKAVYNKFVRFMAPEKMALVYYSVAMPKLERKTFAYQPKTYELVMIGRAAPGKRQEDAIRALAELKKAGIPAKLTFIGTRDAKYGQFLDDLVKELGLEHEVSNAGYNPNPLSLVRLGDTVIVCSKNEAFGRVTVEAMKLGIPVVATRSAGTLEIVSEGETGLLFDPENYHQLAENLKRMYNEKGLLEKLSHNAYGYAWETWNEEKHTENLNRALGV